MLHLLCYDNSHSLHFKPMLTSLRQQRKKQLIEKDIFSIHKHRERPEISHTFASTCRLAFITRFRVEKTDFFCFLRECKKRLKNKAFITLFMLATSWEKQLWLVCLSPFTAVDQLFFDQGIFWGFADFEWCLMIKCYLLCPLLIVSWDFLALVIIGNWAD